MSPLFVFLILVFVLVPILIGSIFGTLYLRKHAYSGNTYAKSYKNKVKSSYPQEQKKETLEAEKKRLEIEIDAAKNIQQQDLNIETIQAQIATLTAQRDQVIELINQANNTEEIDKIIEEGEAKIEQAETEEEKAATIAEIDQELTDIELQDNLETPETTGDSTPAIIVDHQENSEYCMNSHIPVTAHFTNNAQEFGMTSRVSLVKDQISYDSLSQQCVYKPIFYDDQNDFSSKTIRFNIADVKNNFS